MRVEEKRVLMVKTESMALEIGEKTLGMTTGIMIMCQNCLSE